jgi:hypothetical protein
VLGIDATAANFSCVLPGHPDCTARFDRYQYRCAVGRDPLTLGEVFAAQRTGCVRRFPNQPSDGIGESPLSHRWKDRLDLAAGLLSPVPVTVAVPDWAPVHVRLVARSLALTLGLREAGGGFGVRHATTFVRSFICDTTGVTDDQARQALDVLERHGSIRRKNDPVPIKGRRRPATLWEVP